MRRYFQKNYNRIFSFRSIIISFVFMFGILKESIGQTHVQTTFQYQMTTATTIAKAFASASTSGNLIVVSLDWDGQTRSVNSVNDNKGNTYARISGPTNWNGAGNRAELWYAYNITGGALTVTAILSGAPTTFSGMGISEYSGIVTFDPLDKSSVAIGGGPGPAVNSGTQTTAYSNELIYGTSVVSSGTLSAGAGFTSRIASNNIEDKKAAVVGPNSAMFTKTGGGNWIATMAAFYTTSSIILPIDLLSFTGQCNHNNIVLSWATSSETNNDYFTVERSEGGAGWNVIGTVKSNGNSSITQNYSFTTGQSNDKVSYFRLKQTDLDGNFKYFSVIQVENCGQDLTTVSIYSNPTNGRSLFGRINLKANAAYSIVIFDAFGKMVSHSESNQPEFTVNFPQTLPSGVYYARFTSGSFSTVKCFLVAH
jgi:hypothetical protein